MALKLNGTNSVAAPAYAGADADTGLQCGTDEVNLVTGGTARLKIDSSGNVGIGTTSPTSLLFIRGGAATATISSTTNTANLDLINSTQTTRLGAANTAFAITHNGSERMRIDSSGRLGIGTTSPGHKLVVSQNNSGGIAAIHLPEDESTILGSNANTNIRMGGNMTVSAGGVLGFNTNGSESARIDSSGRLLSGLTSSSASASAVFQGFAGSSAGQAILQLQVGKNNAATANNENLGSVRFGNSDAALGALISSEADAQWASSDYPGRLTFHTTADGASSPTERMRITSSGNVGIGTSSPAYEFDVRSSDTTTVNINAGTSNISRLFFSDTTDGLTNFARGFLNYHHSDDSLRIGSAGSETMRIDSDGHTHLGPRTGNNNATEFSDAIVNICGPDPIATSFSKAACYLHIGNNESDLNGLYPIGFGFTSHDRTHVPAYIAYITEDVGSAEHGPLVFATRNVTTDTAPSERMRITSAGKLLLGTTSATGGTSEGDFVVEFAGNSDNAIKTRDTDNTGTVNHMIFVSGSAAVGSITGTTGAASFNNLSDYRRKENDVEIADGIEKVKLLRPIRFNYISDPNTVCDGFFAHEVTPAAPTAVTGTKDAVNSEGEIDPQMLDVSKLVPLLTAALQEAIGKIETLETQHADLLARVTALEAA